MLGIDFNSAVIRYLFLLFVGLLMFLPALFGCQSAFRQETLLEAEYLALYRVIPNEPEKKIDSSPKQITQTAVEKESSSPTAQVQNTQAQLSAAQVGKILESIEIKREKFFSVEHQPLYTSAQLDYIAPQIARGLNGLGSRERLLLITRFDYHHTPLSRHERITALLWFEKSELNIVVGEAREKLVGFDLDDNQSWKTIDPINLEEGPSCCSLIKKPWFEFQEVEGRSHQTWARFSLGNLSAIGRTPQLKPAVDPKIELERKRRLLEAAYRAQLLTAEEYEAKLKSLEPNSE